MTTRRTTLQGALLTTLAPMVVFKILILVVTGALFGEIGSWTQMLGEEAARGQLGQARIDEIGDALRRIWISCVLGLFVFGAITSLLTSWVFRLVRHRLQALAHFLEERMAGRDVPSVAGDGVGPLATLARAVEAVSDEIRTRDVARALEEVSSRFDRQLQRALDLTDSEDEALEVVERALAQVVPDVPAEALLADSSRAHLRRCASNPGAPAPACPVSHLYSCAAIRRGTTLRFDSSENLDACPRLRGREAGVLTAVCTPLNVMGRTIGVLHVAGPVEQPVEPRAIGHLELIATHVGARLGMLRTLSSSQLQARTDPLTGLMNRRSFGEAASRVASEVAGQSCAVAMLDLDHFKRLNDTTGHEAGDRALKLFASILKTSLRPGDLVGRLGGEEFGLLLPGCDAVGAQAALERLRAALAQGVERYGGPPFTCSVGVVTATTPVDDIAPLLERADELLYEAKRQGRNCIVADADAPFVGVQAEEPAAQTDMHLVEMS